MTHASVRRLVAALAVAAAVSVAPPRRALADDPDPDAGWKGPEHESSDMAIDAEFLPKEIGFVPEGARPTQEAEKALTDAIFATAEEQKIPREERTLRLRSVKFPGGEFATFALVDVWVKAEGFPAALSAKAKEKGWAYREMGSPARLLVVAAPEAVREKAVALQVSVAAQRIAERASNEADGFFFDKATTLANTALSFEPGLALAHLTLGRAKLPTQKQGDPTPPPATWEPAIAEYRIALDPKAGVPLAKRDRFFALGLLGNALTGQGGEHNAEARDAYKESLLLAVDLKGATVQWEFRYNLACVHGRLKELDDAFSNLSKVLEQNEKQQIGGIEHWRKDTDFDNLHDDPRWKDLLAKYPEKAPPPDDKKDGK